MNTTIENLAYKESVLALCFVVSRIEADINYFESRMFKFMCTSEKISKNEWLTLKSQIAELDNKQIVLKYMKVLQHCNKDQQLQCLAWMNAIANVDGELGDQEWSVIYDIYKNQLNITLGEILSTELPEMDYSFNM